MLTKLPIHFGERQKQQTGLFVVVVNAHEEPFEILRRLMPGRGGLPNPVHELAIVGLSIVLLQVLLSCRGEGLDEGIEFLFERLALFLRRRPFIASLPAKTEDVPAERDQLGAIFVRQVPLPVRALAAEPRCYHREAIFETRFRAEVSLFPGGAAAQ